MGVRLYPRTANTYDFEQLAQVPEGTAQLLAVAQAAEGVLIQHTPESLQKVNISWSFYELVNPDVARLRDFELFGFGHFDLSLVPREDAICGETRNPRLMQRLLQSAGANVNILLIESLYWC